MECRMTTKLTPVTVDFDAPGKQIGVFHVPLSRMTMPGA
jgi:hypothetical protein